MQGDSKQARCRLLGRTARGRAPPRGTGLGSTLTSELALPGTPEGSGLRAASEPRARMLQPVGGRGRKGDVFN